jgi:hypothetical protein
MYTKNICLIILKFTQPISYVQERGQTRSTPKKPKEAVQTYYITLKSILTRSQTLRNLTLNETFSTRAAAVLYPGLSAMLSVKTASREWMGFVGPPISAV